MLQKKKKFRVVTAKTFPHIRVGQHGARFPFPPQAAQILPSTPLSQGSHRPASRSGFPPSTQTSRPGSAHPPSSAVSCLPALSAGAEASRPVDDRRSYRPPLFTSFGLRVGLSGQAHAHCRRQPAVWPCALRLLQQARSTGLFRGIHSTDQTRRPSPQSWVANTGGAPHPDASFPRLCLESRGWPAHVEGREMLERQAAPHWLVAGLSVKETYVQGGLGQPQEECSSTPPPKP